MTFHDLDYLFDSPLSWFGETGMAILRAFQGNVV